MAMPTKCQTSGAQFHASIGDSSVSIQVDVPFSLNLTDEEAELLEANMHNAMELVLAPYFK